jgi:NADPH-dependent curcumin reductase CurA
MSTIEKTTTLRPTVLIAVHLIDYKNRLWVLKEFKKVVNDIYPKGVYILTYEIGSENADDCMDQISFMQHFHETDQV